MRKSIFIHAFAILLTCAVIGEMCVAWQFPEAISMEIDADGEEEEENKEEDKLKEYFAHSVQYIEEENRLNGGCDFYMIWNWTTPLLDHLTPPPRVS